MLDSQEKDNLYKLNNEIQKRRDRYDIANKNLYNLQKKLNMIKKKLDIDYSNDITKLNNQLDLLKYNYNNKLRSNLEEIEKENYED
tara:strand:+ start:1008 stop:1265 length:258 start_codon:yes stop_codon:yes gene_type:complete